MGIVLFAALFVLCLKIKVVTEKNSHLRLQGNVMFWDLASLESSFYISKKKRFMKCFLGKT